MSTPTPTNIPPEQGAQVPPPYTPPYTPQTQAPPPIPPAQPQKRNTGMIIAVVAIVLLVPVMLCVGAALFAGGIGVFVASSQVEQTSTTQSQVAVPSHPVITISNTSGQVTITNGTVQQVTVEATKRARSTSSQAARNLLDTMTVTAVPTANGANITATTGQNSPFSQQNINLRITVPQTSDLSVTLNAGTLSMTGITGVIHVTTSAGTVTMQNVTAQGATTVNVATGTLRFEGALANSASMNATVNTGNATIRLPQATATHVDASTNVGNVTVSTWAATIQRTGVGQSATFDTNTPTTSTLTVHVDVGSITLGAG